MKNFLIGIVVVGAMLVAALYGIDREVARRDFVYKTELTTDISGCIFQSNCDHYNKLLKETKYEHIDEE